MNCTSMKKRYEIMGNYFKKRTNTTLSRELTRWFFLLAITPLVVVALVSYQQSRAILTQQTVNKLKSSSLLVESFVYNWFEYRQTDITNQSEIKSTIKLLESLTDGFSKNTQDLPSYVSGYDWALKVNNIQNDLVTFLRHYDYVSDLYLLDDQGNIFYSVTRGDDLGTNLLSGPHKKTRFAGAVRRTLSTGSIIFSDLEYYLDDGLVGFLTSPLINDHGDRIGILAMQIKIDRIQKLLKNIDGQDLSHYLVGEDKVLRTSIRGKTLEVLNRKIETEGTRSILLNGSENADSNLESEQEVSYYIGPDGRSVIGFHKHLSILGTKWLLVTEIEESKAFSLANLLGRFVLLLVIMSGLVAMVLGAFSARRMSRPLSQLTEIAERVASGERNQKVVVEADNEIGLLAEAFNHMLEQRQAHEEQLLEAKSNAEAAASAKGEFLAIMSHEIRTPMNGVLGMLGLLAKSKMTREQIHKVDVAQSSAQSLLALINDILDFSKIDAGRLDIEEFDFNLRQLLEEFAESMAYRAQEKGIEFILDISEVGYETVKGDPGRIRQILINLTGNAIKFTEEGEVVVRATLKEGADETLIFNCTVKDTGIGIDAEKITHLFESFSQVDASTTRKYGGTGLGLAIVKRLCELMGGDVFVTSELGNGSCFDFTLKLTHSEQKVLFVPSVDVSSLHVLIVDDNEANREVLRGQLEHWGCHVIEAESGEQALTLCAQCSDDKTSINRLFDVAILDMHMPNMDGADLGKKIRQEARYAEMHLIMMTSLAHRGDAGFFADLGFSAYFTKPYIASDLLDALAIVIDGGDGFEQAKPLVTKHYLNTQRKSTDKDDENSTDVSPWPEQTRLLVVEDNHINLEVVQEMLKGLGLTADQAANGREAVQSIYRASIVDPYTLILMDCQMPVMDGFEATKAIRAGESGERNKDIPIIAMTANAMKGDREKCLAAGMNDYIAKPLEYEELEALLVDWVLGDKTLRQQAQDVAKPIDESRLLLWDKASVLKRVQNNESSVLHLIKLFLDSMPEQMTQLHKAVDSADTEQALKVAHTMKGVAGNLSLQRLHVLLAEFQSSLREVKHDQVLSDMATLKQVFDDSIIQLTDYETEHNSVNEEGELLSKDQIVLVLTELKKSIEAADFIDPEELERLKLGVPAGQERELASKLSDQVACFDNDAALVSISELASLLNIAITETGKVNG